MEMDLEARIKHLHGPEELTYGLDELVVVCLVRDGRPYVKSFVEHYFSLGVKHIVFLDNGSTDGTVEAARSYENVTILQTELPFKEYKKTLKRYLVTRFGQGRWILYVDMDELFDYPYSNVVGLDSFLRYLTEKSYTAVVAQMLDMFPEEPLEGRAGNSKDEPLKELHRFYDISRVRIKQRMKKKGRSRNNVVESEEIAVYKGGIREIVFNIDASLTKHPLMFLDDRLKPMEGPAPSHWVNNAKVADLMCVLFHYKFLDGYFHERIARFKREKHLYGPERYKNYLEILDRDASLQVKQKTSKELKGVNDLLEDGFLIVSEDYLSWVDAEEKKSVLQTAIPQGEPTEPTEAFLKFRRRERAKTLKMQRLGQQQFYDRARIYDLKQQLRTSKQQLKSIQASRTWKLMKMLHRIKARVLSFGRNPY
ncbi:MAG: glycosyltransferase family 2 protein [Rubrobacter sp.]|nr:glycosyltransferase family 2 protein [Rubrobacter sp.]